MGRLAASSGTSPLSASRRASSAPSPCARFLLSRLYSSRLTSRWLACSGTRRTRRRWSPRRLLERGEGPVARSLDTLVSSLSLSAGTEWGPLCSVTLVLAAHCAWPLESMRQASDPLLPTSRSLSLLPRSPRPGRLARATHRPRALPRDRRRPHRPERVLLCAAPSSLASWSTSPAHGCARTPRPSRAPRRPKRGSRVDGRLSSSTCQPRSLDFGSASRCAAAADGESPRSRSTRTTTCQGELPL